MTIPIGIFNFLPGGSVINQKEGAGGARIENDMITNVTAISGIELLVHTMLNGNCKK